MKRCVPDRPTNEALDATKLFNEYNCAGHHSSNSIRIEDMVNNYASAVRSMVDVAAAVIVVVVVFSKSAEEAEKTVCLFMCVGFVYSSPCQLYPLLLSIQRQFRSIVRHGVGHLISINRRKPIASFEALRRRDEIVKLFNGTQYPDTCQNTYSRPCETPPNDRTVAKSYVVLAPRIMRCFCMDNGHSLSFSLELFCEIPTKAFQCVQHGAMANWRANYSIRNFMMTFENLRRDNLSKSFTSTEYNSEQLCWLLSISTRDTTRLTFSEFVFQHAGSMHISRVSFVAILPESDYLN